MTEVLTKIVQLYGRGIGPESESVNSFYSGPPKEMLSTFTSRIADIVDRVRSKHGTIEMAPINLTKDGAQELREMIYNDADWIKETHNLLELLTEKDLRPRQAHNDLSIPWANFPLLDFENETYLANPVSLEIRFKRSHFYLNQLVRSGKHKDITHHPLSIIGQVETNDNLIPIGFRGGHFANGFLMSTPAGSTEEHSEDNSEQDPLFSTFYKELGEELGLLPSDIDILRLSGRALDNSMQFNSYHVFNAHTPLNYSEILERWEESELASDRSEHRYLVPFRSDPESIFRAVEKLTSNEAKSGNGDLLHQAAVPLLMSAISSEGRAWAEGAQKRLNNKYDLTSHYDEQ